MSESIELGYNQFDGEDQIDLVNFLTALNGLLYSRTRVPKNRNPEHEQVRIGDNYYKERFKDLKDVFNAEILPYLQDIVETEYTDRKDIDVKKNKLFDLGKKLRMKIEVTDERIMHNGWLRKYSNGYVEYGKYISYVVDLSEVGIGKIYIRPRERHDGDE